MKEQLTFLFFFLITLTAFAHGDDGIISITNLSRRQVVIEVDGQLYTECNNAVTISNVVTIRNVASGFHMIKIYGNQVRPGTGNRQQVIFGEYLYVKRDYYVDLVINRFGRVLKDEQLIKDNRYDDTEEPVLPISNETFTTLKETINREYFDDSRMAIARPIIDQNNFTAEQAKQLVQLFSFESNKMTIAKLMYGKTTDKKNYFVVYSAFFFSKSKEELAEYIRNYK